MAQDPDKYIKIKKSELEEIVDQKINQKLEKKDSNFEGSSYNQNQISRRKFLKKIGLGAVGISALSVPAASQLKLTGNKISHSSGTIFDFSSKNSLNSDLSLQGKYSIENAKSIGTNEVNYTPGGSANTTSTIWKAQVGTGSDPKEKHWHGSISTSSKQIANLSGKGAGLLIVSGREQNGTKSFSDLVLVSRPSQNITVIASESADNPDSRNYTKPNDKFSTEVEMYMSSSTYDVGVRVIEVMR